MKKYIFILGLVSLISTACAMDDEINIFPVTFQTTHGKQLGTVTPEEATIASLRQAISARLSSRVPFALQWHQSGFLAVNSSLTADTQDTFFAALQEAPQTVTLLRLRASRPSSRRSLNPVGNLSRYATLQE